MIGYRLESIAGPLKGEVFPLAREPISIGSDPSNELAIYDASISERHCVITRERVIEVTDLEIHRYLGQRCRR